MNLYLLSQDQNDDYDTYDSCIVAAADEESAKLITPGSWGYSWCKSPEYVDVELIGKALEGTKEGVILASFNAG